MQFLKISVNPEVPHMLIKRAIILWRLCGTRVGGLDFPLKGPGKLVAMAMASQPSRLVTQQTLCER